MVGFGPALDQIARFLLIVAVVAFLFWTYYLIYSALRNVKLIRLQLERLNDNMENGGMNIRFTTEHAAFPKDADGRRGGASVGPLKL